MNVIFYPISNGPYLTSEVLFLPHQEYSLECWASELATLPKYQPVNEQEVPLNNTVLNYC